MIILRKIKKFFGVSWPLILAIGVLWLAIGYTATVSFSTNQGNVIYALDDPYIHMAIAKHITKHGVFGVTPYEYSSSSSSLFWVFLLVAVYFIFGASEIAPLFLNVVFATGSLVMFFCLAHRHLRSKLIILPLLLFFIYLTPLVPLIFTGMEHTLHILAALFFSYVAATSLSAPQARLASGREMLLLGLCFLAVTTRYEAIFQVFVIVLLFLMRKHFLTAIALTCTAAIPIMVYGLYSISQGNYWLPNPLMIYGSFPEFGSIKAIIHTLGYGAIKKLMSAPHLYTMIISCVGIFIFNFKKYRVWDTRQLLLIIVVLTSLLHLQFAQTGWFYRYEAYLIALAIFAISLYIGDYSAESLSQIIRGKSLVRTSVVIVLAILLLYPSFFRAKIALQQTVPATRNIYEQQYQMGRFLSTYYDGQSIAANDIGVINYSANIQCLDLTGLASAEILQARKSRNYTTSTIAELTKKKNTQIALVYLDWFGRDLPSFPSNWTLVGSWTIENNVICAEKTVSFLAVKETGIPHLRESLISFSEKLPPSVVESGPYTRN